MSASFEEKSVWIQVVSLVVALGGYLVAAFWMAREGVTELAAYMPLFVAAVVVQVILLIVGHTVAAIAQKPEHADERDRLIAWRAEARSSWLLAVGVLAAVSMLAMGIAALWVAHVLIVALFVSTLLGYVLQMIDYRRGF